MLSILKNFLNHILTIIYLTNIKLRNYYFFLLILLHNNFKFFYYDRYHVLYNFIDLETYLLEKIAFLYLIFFHLLSSLQFISFGNSLVLKFII